MPKLTSQRAAARAVGVSATTISRWLKAGRLAPAPWTLAQLRKMSRPGAAVGVSHGTLSRWRHGCDCGPCGRAHVAAQVSDRAAARDARLGPIWVGLLAAIRDGQPLGEACAERGETAGAVWSMLAADPDRRAQLDAALMDGRDESMEHGREQTYRSPCRCPECRAARSH